MRAPTHAQPARRLWRALAAALALATAAPAPAQTAGGYEVELIVFRRSPEARSSAEDSALPAAAWPRDAGVLSAGEPTASRSPPPEAAPGAEGLSGSAEPEAAEAIELGLGSVWRRLERLPAYEPLLHVAWLAEAPPRDQAPARPVEAGMAPGPELLGQVRLFRQRSLFLDLELDLLDVLPPPPAEASTDPDPAGPALSAGPGDRAPVAEQPPLSSGLGVFRLRETRKMRPGEIHYFDHPAFGAIATLRSRDPEAEPEAADVDPGVPP